MRRSTRSTATTTGGMPVVDAGVARTRRRFARRQWRRRWGVWKYVVALVLLLALVATGVWAVLFSSWLSVSGVDVAGSSGENAARVRQVAAVPRGGPLATVDLAAIERRVESLAFVKDADVTREWPDQVLVTVSERVPVATVRIGGQVRVLDADGVIFGDPGKAPRGLPSIVTGSGSDSAALKEGATVVAALTDVLLAVVDHVQVVSVDVIDLALQDGRTIHWGNADDSGAKAAVAQKLLAQDVKEIDVSVPGRPTTRD